MLDSLTMEYPHADDELFVDHGVEGGLRKEDVWGYSYMDSERKLHKAHNGLVVAEYDPEIDPEFDKDMLQYLPEVAQECGKLPGVCPIWGDRLGYKSSTLVAPADDPMLLEAVEFWISYVMGGSATKKSFQDDGTVAFRADYQA